MSVAGSISLARGAPSIDIVATEALRACADRALAADPQGAFSYGTSAGYPPLRSWIAERNGVARDQVIVTNGSLQADVLLFQLLIEPGDVVVVEAPTYDRTLLALRELGAEIVAIPLQDDGIDVGGLARALEAGARPKLAHVIPNFQNPAGYTLSLEKRRRLLELAEAHDFVVFEDDPYVELRFEGEDLPTMLSMGGSGKVVYASSFSKTVCPGIRVGYLAGPASVISAVEQTATNTYISPNMVAQAIVAEFCRSGAIWDSVENVKRALRERRDALVDALQRELPDARFTPPQGGYFLWVELPEQADAGALAEVARERGVTFVPGADFLLEGGRNALRLAYSGATPDQIGEGVSRLAEGYDSLAGVPS